MRSSLTDRLTVLSASQLAEAVRTRLPRAAEGGAQATGAGDEPAPDSGEIVVTGVRHVLRMLAAAEAGALSDTAVLDLSLCDTGCAGSPLLSADPYLARRRLTEAALMRDTARADAAAAVPRARAYAQREGVRLDADMGRAIGKLARIDAMTRALPGQGLRRLRGAVVRRLCRGRGHGTSFRRWLSAHRASEQSRGGGTMTLGGITARLGLEILTPELSVNGGAEVTRGHASDLLSDVLANAPSGGVLITIQVHMNVVAVALHAGLAAVVFAQGMRPEENVRRKAVEEGLPLLASADSTFDIAGKLYGLGLRGKGVET